MILLHPIPASGHRYINKRELKKNKLSYSVYIYKDNYKTKTFKTLTDALCLKFIRILKYNAKIGI